jgi:DNA-binding MarR family transcriptional regulator
MKISEKNLRIWLWLCSHGGLWTAQELAQRLGGNSQDIFRSLHAMSRRQLLAKYPPDENGRYYRYGVTGTCLIPYGVSVAEAQA